MIYKKVEKVSKFCVICKVKFLCKNKNQILCSIICRKKYYDSVKYKGHSKDYDRREWIVKYKQNIKRSHRYVRDLCPYCRKKMMNIQEDHIFPKKLGGLDVKSNMLSVCGLCNSSKKGEDLMVWANKMRYPLSNEILKIYKFNYKIHSYMIEQQEIFYNKLHDMNLNDIKRKRNFYEI